MYLSKQIFEKHKHWPIQGVNFKLSGSFDVSGEF